jgi:hypothetical protein
MERYSVVRFKAGMGLASDMGVRFKVTDIDGDRIELHHDRVGYRFADRSKLEPWVNGSAWTGSEYIDLVPTQPEDWVRSVDPVFASDPNAPTTVLVDREVVALRDRFALSAMETWLYANAVRRRRTVDQDLEHIRKTVASAAYAWADAMLEARNGNASHVTG